MDLNNYDKVYNKLDSKMDHFSRDLETTEKSNGHYRI